MTLEVVDCFWYRYGVHNFRESAERIVANAKEAPRDNFLVLLAHNGPRGTVYHRHIQLVLRIMSLFLSLVAGIVILVEAYKS